MLEKIDFLAEERGALIAVDGDPEPELLADLDRARVGKTRMRELTTRYLRAIDRRLLNWSIVGYPNEGWAQSGVRRARRRAALGGDRHGDAPRRGRPGRGLARAPRQARASSAPS